MIDLIVLFFLTKEIGKLSLQKGVNPLTWKIYTIVSWLISEILGFIVALMIFEKDNIISIVLVGFLFAITSYFIIKAQLNKLPDQNSEDDINNIGRN
jgi:L-asparagine transporter-like permease